MPTITSVVEIDSTPSRVWEVLTDTAAYAEWNPFITRLEGRLQPAERLAVRIQPPGQKPMTFRPTVTVVEPGRRLAWQGRLLMPGLFDGAHSFTLEPLADARTRFTQSESFRGVLAWVAAGLLTRTQAGFETMNEALRLRVLAQDPR